GAGLQQALEGTETRHVVDPREGNHRDRGPRDRPAPPRGTSEDAHRTAPSRRAKDVGLVHQPADPGDHAEQVEPHGEERHGLLERGPRARRNRWVARDEARPGSAPHATSHSTVVREPGTIGEGPETGEAWLPRPPSVSAASARATSEKSRNRRSGANAPTRRCSRSPVGRGWSRAPASMLPVRRPTTASGRALNAGTSSRIPGMIWIALPSPRIVSSSPRYASKHAPTRASISSR